MRKPVLVIGAALVAAITALLALLPTAVKRLPDGTPDIRGTWMKIGGGLDEANPPDTELKMFGAQSEPQGFGEGPVATGPGGEAADTHVPKYLPDPRPPRGIIDPPDRMLPYTPQGRARRLDHAKNMCCPAKSLAYLELSIRCAPPQPWAGGGVHIMQRPGQITLLFEDNHHTRVFYTDGRRHPSSSMRFFSGHSTARWEGDTLVVDTTNLDGRAYFGAGNTFPPFSEALHLTEHFTVVSDRLITFVVTYDDPEMFTRPVKSAGYLYLANEDEELAPELTCHEGSYSMPNIFGF